MLGFIFRLLLAILAFRIIGGAVRALTRRGNERPPRKGPRAPREGKAGADGAAGKSRPYEELTPYEIEDAEYEELPDRED